MARGGLSVFRHAHRGHLRHPRQIPRRFTGALKRRGRDLASRRRVRAGDARRIQAARETSAHRTRQQRVGSALAAGADAGARRRAIFSATHRAETPAGRCRRGVARAHPRAARRSGARRALAESRLHHAPQSRRAGELRVAQCKKRPTASMGTGVVMSAGFFATKTLAPRG